MTLDTYRMLAIRAWGKGSGLRSFGSWKCAGGWGAISDLRGRVSEKDSAALLETMIRSEGPVRRWKE